MEPAKRTRRAMANKVKLTELLVRRLKPSGKDDLIWDAACEGLHVLVGAGGTLTYRAYIRVKGKPVSYKLGRVKASDDGPGLSLTDARLLCREARVLVERGHDPRKGKPAELSDLTRYDNVVTRFIAEYAKPRQRTWDQTERILRGPANDTHPWLEAQITAITPDDIKKRLRQFIDKEGKPYKARVLKCWLRTFFKWAILDDVKGLDRSPMDKVAFEIEEADNQWAYSDDEIQALWRAATALPNEEECYVKLLILLAPRKSSLALLRRSHLSTVKIGDAECMLWTTPWEQVKAAKKTKKRNRQYLCPLPPMAQRLVERLKGDDRLFPSLPITASSAGRLDFKSDRLKAALIRHGAPATLTKNGERVALQFHAWRHTIATWLENQGYSLWERGLALNHAEGGVTAGYSHGYPAALKLKLLTEWADHIAAVVGENVVHLPTRGTAG